MRKLRLQLDDLRIDTFDTTAPQRARGTVFGEQCTCWTQCGQNTCPGCPTCDASCNGTCAGSCNGTCASCDASCNGTCDWTCDYTCGDSCGGYTCDTSPDPRQPCMICGHYSSIC
ncbi:MAG TPA: hypothetical protein VFY65_05775 [Longimicrobium sp.]|nr:hypothetical protein [Longimicrobium sp.]